MIQDDPLAHNCYLPTKLGFSICAPAPEDPQPAIHPYTERKKSSINWRLIKYIFVGLIGAFLIGFVCMDIRLLQIATQLGLIWGLLLTCKYISK